MRTVFILISIILSGCTGITSQYPSQSVADAVIVSCDSGVVNRVQSVEQAIDNSLFVYVTMTRIRAAVQARGDYDIRLNLSNAIEIDCPE